MLQRLAHREGSPTLMRRQRLMDTLPIATATVVVMAIVFSAIPLILRVLSVTDPMYLIPFGIAGLALVWLTWESLDRFHKKLAEIIALQPARRGEIDASSDKLDE
jgi:hypothetical protein